MTISHRILIIGDNHFMRSNSLETDEMTIKILDIARNNKFDFAVLLGDILDTHETIHIGPFCRAINFMENLSKLVPHMFVIVGNHDRPNNTVYLTEEHPFSACKSWKNTTIVDNVVEWNNYLFVPYVQVGRFHEAINSFIEESSEESFKKFNIIFAHQEFKGCSMGAIKSEHGDEYPQDYPLCISGHIHIYEELQPNLIYPGTPIQHSYGDSPDKAIVDLTFNFEEKSFSYNRIKLGLPKKLVVHINAEDLLEYKIPENSFIKLVVSGQNDKVREIMKLDKVKELLASQRVKLSIQDLKKSKINEELSDNPELLSDVINSKFIPFQTRIVKILSQESPEIQSLFTKIFTV
jgi:DNA repair exonuclease SbcCD nuclease subunit